MRNRIIYITIFLLLATNFWAAPVDPNLAQQVAENFINAPEANASGTILKAPRKQKRMARAPRQITADQQFYIFNSEDGEGFVIVAADDVVRPILGYSLTENMDIDSMPDNLKQWLDEYNNQIVWAQQNSVYNKIIRDEWNRLKTGTIDIGTVKVGPLLTTAWDQNKYYNSKCPTTWLGILGDDGHVYAGCTACAMAQTMKYWNYPTQGCGSFTNTQNPSYGDLYVNFGNTTYDWQSMPNKLTSSSTTTQVNAVATLMYHCGVSINTDYGYNGSGASPAIVPFSACAYFRYSNLISLIERDKHTPFSWYMVITRQLDNNRPVLYSGFSSTGKNGHSFVCDGYTSKMYFHFNWGWSGKGNNIYFLLDALLPDSNIDGSGAGDHDYRFYQNAIVNFVPDGMFEMDSLQMVSDWSLSKDTIDYGEDMTASVDIYSYASRTFQGNIYAVVLDRSGNVVMALDSLMKTTLEIGDQINIVFSNQSVRLDAGRYYLSMAYQAWNSVGVIGGDFYSNIIPFYVRDSYQQTQDNYVILAQRDAASNWFYMTSDLGSAGTKRYQAVDAGTPSLANVNTSNLDSKYYWQIEDTKLHTAAGYSTWTAGNSATLDNTGKDLSIEKQTDGTYIFSFIDGDNNTRRLALNKDSRNNYFAYYKGQDQIHKLTLIKEGEVWKPENLEFVTKQPSATKLLRNGQILILRGTRTYTLTGQEVK